MTIQYSSAASAARRRSGAFAAFAAATVCVWSAAGCASNARLSAVESRVSDIERGRQGVKEAMDLEQKRLERLHAQVEESSGYLRKNGAKISADLDRLRDNVRKFTGTVEELSHQLAALASASGVHQTALLSLQQRLDSLVADLRDRAGITVLALPHDLPEHADDWVKLANERHAAGESRVAEAVAKECQKRFLGTSQAGECGLVRADIAFEEQRFGEATEILQSVHDSLEGRPVPVVGEALLGIARVLEAQGHCKRANEVYKYLRSELKKLPQASKATERLRSQGGRCKEGVPVVPEVKPAPASAPGAAPEAGGLAPAAGARDDAPTSDDAGPAVAAPPPQREVAPSNSESVAPAPTPPDGGKDATAGGSARP